MGDQEDLANVAEALAQLGEELALVKTALGNHGFRPAPPTDTSISPEEER